METIKFIDKKLELDVTVSPERDTVWLNQNQIAQLFDKERRTITRHINHIYSEKELLQSSTCAFFAQVQNEGGRLIKRNIKYYNLDLIISVGYRVNSKRGILFRQWANNILKQYLINGYALDSKRIKLIDSNYTNLVYDVNKLKKDNKDIKLEIDKLNNKSITNFESKLFIDGQVFDATKYIKQLISKANKQIILIDPYISIETLDYFVNLNCPVYIFSSTKSRITQDDISKFNKEYGNLYYSVIDNIHDRFLIIDSKDLYSLGTSLNYVGKKLFVVLKINNNEILQTILKQINIY